MEEYCKTHKHGFAGLDEKMKTLPRNQGGEGRHKCPYCAYVEGFEDGAEYERNRNSSSDD